MQLFGNFNSCLLIPLTSHDKLFGAVLLGPKEDDRPFSKDEIELLSTLSSPICISLENSEFYENLKGVSDLKSQFVHIASHQLRTPVSILRWTLNFLSSEGQFSASQREYIQSAEQTIKNMVHIIDNLLDISNIESGEMKLNKSEEHIEAILEEAIKETDILRKEKNITLDSHVSSPLPSLTVDREKIREVLIVLLDNAVKYTPRGGRITITHIVTSSSIELVFTDTGVGVPKKDMAQLFTKFYRGSNVSPMETRGSGLGLFIAKTFVELHQGNIWIKSEESKGTSVFISLPRG